MTTQKMFSLFCLNQSFKFLLALLILLLTSNIAFSGNIITEIIEEQIWESLGKFLPADPREDPQKALQFAKYVKLAAEGNPDEIFNDATSNWSTENLAVSFISKVLPELVEGAGGGPIGLLIMAKDLSFTYTQYMLDFYKDDRKKLFKEKVIDKSETPEELTKNYNDFFDIGETGNIWTNILHADRKQLEDEFKQVYDKRMEQMKFEQRVKEARQKVKERLKGKMDFEKEQVEVRVKTAIEYLKAANMEANKQNIQKMLKNANFYNEVKLKVQEEIKKNPQQNPTSIIKKPFVYKARADMIKKKEIGLSLPDFGELLKTYGDASDNLLNGNLELDAYNEIISQARGAAGEFYDAIESRKYEIEKDEERTNFIKSLNTLYNNFSDACNTIDKNLNGYANKLKETLNEIVRSIEKSEKPSKFSREIQDEYSKISKPSPTYEKLLPPSLAKANKGKQTATLKEFESGYKELQQEVTLCNLLISFINEKSVVLDQKIEKYSEELIKVRSNYSEQYNKNITLVKFAKIGMYEFKEEEKNLDLAKTFLVDSILSAKNISSFTRIRVNRIRASRELREQTELNRKVIPEIENVIKNEDSLVRCNIENTEKGFIITKKYLDTYYDKHFKDLMNFVPSAYSLLSEKTWDDLRNDIVHNSGADLTYLNKAVDSPVYTTLENHRKKLKELEKEIKQLKEIDLETRVVKMEKNKGIADKNYGLVKQVSGEMEGFSFISLELQDVYDKFQKLHQLTYKALSDSKLSEFESVFDKKPKLIPLKMFEDVYNQYLSTLEKSEQFEKEALMFFEKYVNYTVTSINPPDEYYRLINTYGETNIPYGKIKHNMRPTFEVSRQYYDSYMRMKSNMEKQVDKARLEDHYKKNPVKTIFINGKEVDPGKLDLKAEKLSNITIRRKDLINGKIEIKGEIYNEAPKYVGGINLSFDAGKTYETKAKITGNIFTYNFEPEDEKVYWIKVKSLSTAGEEANSFPSTFGNGIGVYFTTEKSADEILEIKDIRIQDIKWNSIDGTLKLTKDDLINGYVEIKGYTGKGFGNFYDNGKPIGLTKLEVNIRLGWQEVKWIEGNMALSPWVFRFVPAHGEQKISIRAVNPDNIYSDPMDFSPIKLIYDPISRQFKIEEMLNKLKDTFERKDVSGFMKNVSDDFYGGEDVLRDQLRRFFDAVNTLRLYIVVDTYRSQKNRKILDTHWERTLVSNTTSKQYKQSGYTTFVFDTDENKLLGMKGDSIFVVLSDDKEPLAGIEEKLQEQPKEKPKPKLPSGKITMYNEYDVQKGFSFSQGVLVDLGSGEDFYWNTDGMPGTVPGGIVDLGSKDLDLITSVSTTGYVKYPDWITAKEGHSYAVKTRDNKYGIIYIETINDYPASIIFIWKYQPDGTTTFW